MIERAVTLAATAEPVLTFEEESHVYRLDGVEIPSVSRILALRFGRMPDAPWIQAAADRGRKAHLACELWDCGDLDEESIRGSDLEGYLRGWAKWCGERDEWVLIEHKLCGVVEGVAYAGTIDRLNYVRGLCDIKTKGKTGRPPQRGSDEWTRVALQLAAYAALLARTPHAHVDRRQAVWLWPNGSIHVEDFTRWNDVHDEEWRTLLRSWRESRAEEERCLSEA